MIKAIIFDFDGTIIDTETAWYHAFRDAYLEHGVELTLEQYSGCIGTSLHNFNPYEYLMTDLKLPIDKDAFRESVHLQHTSLMQSEQVRSGILDYLNDAQDLGMRIGLASSSPRAWIDKYLEQLEIAHYFETIRTADDVAKVKPDPELYMQTLAALGVEASEAVAIEDSPNGARAALAAGMSCIIVPNTITKSLDFDKSDRYYHAECLSHIDFHAMAAGAL
ncbi:HAD family hydrolase [Paenibacillus sp. LHD-38]|uniref:HAD family hydrolase n=1 Tax=Paenibacillus sp. LHD-38 TaxID=3072143 RepID=UPI00280E0092|nr:HAD family hydrolase [Paenibacillus sp. LHD-38]MDQ8738335.1 HAD family hydrolase [Paenibacillus sp. LHD-38]